MDVVEGCIIINGSFCILYTLLGTNISPQKWHFEDDVPFPKVGYVNCLEGNDDDCKWIMLHGFG